jgi:glycosyltransferase involved in cell wall biosynthesis
MFYSIFQWIERKNPMGLLRAYWAAFPNKENVALVLKTYRMNYEQSEVDTIKAIIKNLKKVMPLDNHPPVYLISHMLSEEEILGLHARGDCYVSLDRGEGFGLSPFTAGACGNPIIVTNFGGSKEYAKEHTSYRVDCHKTPVFGMPQSPWYRGDQLWAEPSLEHAMTLMRHAYNNKTEAFARGQILRNYIEEHFSWDVIGKRIIEEIKKI